MSSRGSSHLSPALWLSLAGWAAGLLACAPRTDQAPRVDPAPPADQARQSDQGPPADQEPPAEAASPPPQVASEPRPMPAALEERPPETAAALQPPAEAESVPPPRLALSSPLEGFRYGARVLVSGRAAGDLQELAYSLRSTEVFAGAPPSQAGAVALGAEGAFSFVVATRGLRGPQELRLQARARDGRETDASVLLLPGDSDLPGFVVEPGDGRLTLRWEPLPDSESYAVVYRSENPGQPPGRERQERVERPPHVLAGLENGNLYVLRLKAVLAGEEEAWSAARTAVPCSPGLLQLAAQPEARGIRLSWRPIPASGSYEVRRATSAGGSYVPLGGPVAERAYLDREARYGQEYFYKVQPVGFPYAESDIARGRLEGAPEQKVEGCGSVDLEGTRGMFLSGAYLYAAAGTRGLQVIDVADPHNPTVVGSCPTEGASAVAVRGGLACVADGARGLVTLDVTEPRRPKVLGTRKTTEARAVYLRGSYAFVADGPGGLKVLDLSTPTQPTRVAALATQDAWDVTGRGDLVYLADGRGGLLLVGAADPAAPVLLQRLPAGDARALSLSGEMLLLADGQEGLQVFDASQPAAPVQVGSYRLPGALDVAGDGPTAYLAAEGQGVAVLDLSDPRRPSASSMFGEGSVRAVAAAVGYAFSADGRGVSSVRVLAQGTSFPVASAGTGGKAFRVLLSGGTAYVAGHDAGVSLIDVTGPASVADRSRLAGFQTEYAAAVAVGDGRLYVADGRRGIKVLDPAATPSAALEAELFTGGNASGLALAGSRLFVAAGEEGLKVIDVSDPRAPVQIAESPSRDARDVAVRNNRLFVADTQEGLILFDISDPAAPRRVTSLPALRGFRLAQREERVFVAGPAGLHAVEVGGRAEARHLGSYSSPFAEDVALDGPYAYLAEGHRGLTVLDVSRPQSPRPVSSCPEVYAVGVAARGDYAFVVDSKGLQVIRVLIPEWLGRR